MSGDDELGLAASPRGDKEFQQFELTARRKRRFRLIQQIEAFALIPAFEERHERLAVRLRDQRLAAEVFKLAGIVRRPLIEELGEVVKNVRTEKRAGHAVGGPFYGKGPMQCPLDGIVVKAPPVLITPDVNSAQAGERFEEGRLSRAVFADKKRDRRVEQDGLFVVKDREIEGVAVPGGVGVGMKCNAFEMHRGTS